MLSISLDISWPFEIPQLRILFLALYPILQIGVFGSLESNFLGSLYILHIRPLLNVGLVKIFSQSAGCHFVLLTVSFALQKLFNFRRSHLSIVALTTRAISVLFRKNFPVLMCLGLFPTFSSIIFSVPIFMWRLLIYLDFSFVQGDKNGSICILLHANCHLNQHDLFNILCLFHWMVLCFLLKMR